MTRRFWLAALIFGAAAACKTKGDPPAHDPGPSPRVVTDAPAGQIALGWTIEKAGKTSYLVATIDAGVDVATQVPAALWDRIKASRTVALQWNLAEVTMAMLQRHTGALSTDLTADENARLEAAIGAPFVADLEKVKPSFAATVVSAYGLATTNPMQAVINEKAQAMSVPTVYLETGVDQQALLDRWLDVRALKALIADLDGVKRGNAELLAAYVRGDEVALAGMRDRRLPWKTAGRSGADLAALDKATLDDRHAAWLGFLRPLLDGGNVVVAVDVGDAVGPAGLVEALRKTGYRVTRAAP